MGQTIARNANLSVPQFVVMANKFLAPKLEYGFRHAVFSKSELDELDRTITRCVQALCNIPHALNRHAVSKITGVVLPSTLLTKVKLSETFIRLNLCSDASYTGRQRWLSISSYDCRQKWNRLTDITNICKRLGWDFKNKHSQIMPREYPPRSDWQHYPYCPVDSDKNVLLISKVLD